MINQIAKALNVDPEQIKSVREMAWVYCVVVYGRRATFVSKKVVAQPKKTQMQIWAEEIQNERLAEDLRTAAAKFAAPSFRSSLEKAEWIAEKLQKGGIKQAKVWAKYDKVRIYVCEGEFISVSETLEVDTSRVKAGTYRTRVLTALNK
jgi:hypothetical protein